MKTIMQAKYQKICQELQDIKTYLFCNPEVGGTEEKSSKRLMESLESHGFMVTKNYKEVDHAFRAVYESQKPGPTIGFMAEMDALPEIGHACGHNLIAAISLGAAYCLQSVIEEIGGTIVVLGTPAEETFCRKMDLVAQGAFAEIDIAMMVHPNPTTYTSGSTLALESLQIEFFGVNSHAGICPELGKNALDAAVMCYQSIGFEKQYLKDTNLYGIIHNGGEKASVIPEFTSLRYLSRAKNVAQLAHTREMMERCANAAAIMTGCTYRIWNNEPTNKDMRSNPTLATCFDQHLMDLGESFICKDNLNGSTDMGDVSYVVPSIHPWVGINRPDLALHQKEFADATLSQDSLIMMERSVLALAYTATDVIRNPELLQKIQEEFKGAQHV